MSVKKALSLVEETERTLDDNWYNTSLGWVLEQLAKVKTELKEEL